MQKRNTDEKRRSKKKRWETNGGTEEATFRNDKRIHRTQTKERIEGEGQRTPGG